MFVANISVAKDVSMVMNQYARKVHYMFIVYDVLTRHGEAPSAVRHRTEKSPRVAIVTTSAR